MKTFCNTCGQQLRIHDKEPRGKVKPIPSSPSSVDVEPDTEHGMSSEELAGRFGAHFKPAAPEAGVEAASPLHKESCVSQALDNGRFPVRDVAEAGVEVEREEAWITEAVDLIGAAWPIRYYDTPEQYAKRLDTLKSELAGIIRKCWQASRASRRDGEGK